MWSRNEGIPLYFKDINLIEFMLDKGDVVSFRTKSGNNDEFKAIVEANKSKTVPGWLEVDREKMGAHVLTFPSREEVGIPIEEHLVVELYSR